VNPCTQFQDDLAACATAEDVISAEASSHLRGCTHCQARFSQWKQVARTLSETAGNLPLPKGEPRLETWFAEKVSGTSESSLPGLNFGRVLGASVAAIALIILSALIISFFSPKEPAQRLVVIPDAPPIGAAADPINPAAVPTLGAMRRELHAANSANFDPVPHAPEGFRPYRLKDAYLESRN
jgi:hypothetical protein